MVAISPFFNVPTSTPDQMGGVGSLAGAIQSAMDQSLRNQQIKDLALSNQASQLKLPFLQDQIKAQILKQQLSNQFNQEMMPYRASQMVAGINQKVADAKYKTFRTTHPGVGNTGTIGDVLTANYYLNRNKSSSSADNTMTTGLAPTDQRGQSLQDQLNNALNLKNMDIARQANPLTKDQQSMLTANGFNEGQYYNAVARGYNGTPEKYTLEHGGDPSKRIQELTNKELSSMQEQDKGRFVNKYLMSVTNKLGSRYRGYTWYGFNPLLLKDAYVGNPNEAVNGLVASALTTPSAISELQNLGARTTQQGIKKMSDTLIQGLQSQFQHTPFGPGIMNLVSDKILYHLLESQHQMKLGLIKAGYQGIKEPDQSPAMDKNLYVNPLWKVAGMRPDIRKTVINGNPVNAVAVRDMKTQKVYEVPEDKVQAILDGNKYAQVVEVQ